MKPQKYDIFQSLFILGLELVRVFSIPLLQWRTSLPKM